MAENRVVQGVFGVLALVLSTGCISLTIFNKTEIVRSEEPRLPVKFETVKASCLFQEKVAEQPKEIARSKVGVPFVNLSAKAVVLADSAHFNEELRKCDSDQDGLITETEARIYAGKGPVDEDKPLGPLLPMSRPLPPVAAVEEAAVSQ
jgi:hypothetical protein